MPRVLLLLPTTTYRTQAFMEAAERLGVEVTVASDERSTLTALNPTGLLTLDFANPSHAAQQVLEFAARHPIAAVVPVDDQVAATGARIAEALGLRSNSVESTRSARDKHCMRERLAACGVPQPRFRLASFRDDPTRLARAVQLPCVIKPRSLAASQGVIRANDVQEFVAAVGRLERIVKRVGSERSCHDAAPASQSPEYGCSGLAHSDLSGSPSEFLIEEFIPGAEVAVEGLLTNGELRVLAIFDKPDALDGPFFEETMYVTPSRHGAEMQEAIAEVTEHASSALGLVHGPIHAELRLETQEVISHRSKVRGYQSGPYVIEVNPRSIGGLCSRVLRFGTGLSLEELIIRHAIEPNYEPPERESLAAGVMMIPIPKAGTLREVHGLDPAKSVGGIEEVVISAHVGQKLVPLPEGSLYLGFIFARGDSPDRVEAALRDAHRRIDFVIDP